MKAVLIKTLDDVYNLKGLIDIETGRKLEEMQITTRNEFINKDQAIYTFIKMLKENQVEIIFKDEDSKDYKYLKKCLKEDK